MLYLVLIVLIILLVLEKIINIKNLQKENNNSNKDIDYSEKYIKKEYLLTQTELKFYKILKNITDDMNLVICPQVPLYEIVKNIEYKDFNRISSKSIDFVITEQNLKIKLCIELDDYTHKQAKRTKRDNFVNKLLSEIKIKILRIPVQNFYDKEKLKNDIIEKLQE
jgi:hypothetical protein